MPYPESTEQLEIDGFEFLTPAWWVLDLSPLWGRAAAVGEDLPVPGGATIPRRRDLPTWRVVLPMGIGSDVDVDGVPHPIPTTGLEENVDAIMAAIDNLTSGDGTRELVLTRASGALWSADCHVIGLDFGTVTPSGTANAALELSIPAGKLTAGVSSS